MSRTGNRAKTIGDLWLELFGCLYRELGDVNTALAEFQAAVRRARVAVPQTYWIELPGGDRLEMVMTGSDFSAFEHELDRRCYSGKELAVCDEAGRIKAWVTAGGWRRVLAKHF